MPSSDHCSSSTATAATATRAQGVGAGSCCTRATARSSSSSARLAPAMAAVPTSDLRCPQTRQLLEGIQGPSRPARPSPKAITSTPAVAAAGCWGQ